MEKNGRYRARSLTGRRQGSNLAFTRGFMRSLGQASRLPETGATQDQPGPALESPQRVGLLFAVLLGGSGLNLGLAQQPTCIKTSGCQAPYRLMRGVCPSRIVRCCGLRRAVC